MPGSLDLATVVQVTASAETVTFSEKTENLDLRRHPRTPAGEMAGPSEFNLGHGGVE